LPQDGPNAIEAAHPHRGLRLLVAQFTSPIVVILVAATVLSMALGDLSDGLIILVIVAASGALGFWQERTAGHAVDALMAQVRVEVEVRRGGGQVSVPVEEVVVGDLVVLRAGDVVPADGRVVRSQGLLVDEAALTGFERGITQFGVLLVRAMVVLVTAIFVVNSVFDILTFAVLRLGFAAGATLFRSGWFIESTVTEEAVMLVLRTNLPFYRSRPGRGCCGRRSPSPPSPWRCPTAPLAGPLGLTAVPRGERA
jgi:P-type Mg2+ transporter